MSFKSQLKSTFTVRKRTRTPDGQGGYSYSNDDTLEIKGLLRQMDSSETEIAGKIRSVEGYRLYCEPADINAEDQILDADSKIYEVSKPNDIHGLGRVMQVDLRFIQ